jgi:hypothetical protein
MRFFTFCRLINDFPSTRLRGCSSYVIHSAMLKLQQPATPCIGADAVKGEARTRVMRSGGRRGRSRDGDASLAAPSVRGRGRRRRRRAIPIGRVEQRPCRLFGAQRQPQRWPDRGARPARRGGVRLQHSLRQFNSGRNRPRRKPPAPRVRIAAHDRNRSRRDLGLWWGVGPRRAHPHWWADTEVSSKWGRCLVGPPPGVGGRWFPRILLLSRLPQHLQRRPVAVCAVYSSWAMGVRSLPRCYPCTVGMGAERDCTCSSPPDHPNNTAEWCRPISKFIRKKKEREKAREYTPNSSAITHGSTAGLRLRNALPGLVAAVAGGAEASTRNIRRDRICELQVGLRATRNLSRLPSHSSAGGLAGMHESKRLEL